MKLKLIGAIAITACLGRSQQPAFDVVSVKPSRTISPLYYKSASKRFMAANMTPKQLMALGWGIRNFQISGGDGWFSSDNFDIEATTSEPATWGQMKLMFRSLLADRFKLIVHQQVREAPVYTLVVAKGGIRMKLSPDQTPWTGDHPNEPGTTGANMDPRPNSLTGDSVPLAMFINYLTGEVDRTVINKTGSTARYAIDLRFDQEAGPSIFTAIQEQLGLKLESGTGPVEMFIIDQVERPSAN